MSALGLEKILAYTLPDLVSPPPDPPGAFLARELKKIHDDSCGVLPRTSHSNRGPGPLIRWSTMYVTDYVPVSELEERAKKKEDLAKSKGKARKEEQTKAKTLASDVMAEAQQSKMFMNWNVPARLTSDGKGEVQGNLLEREMSNMNIAASRGIPEPPHTQIPDTPMLPQISSSSPRLASHHSGSRLGTSHRSLGTPGQQLMSPRKSLSRQSLPAKPVSPRKQLIPKAQASRELFKNYLQKSPDVEEMKDWLRNASEEDKRLVEKAIRLASLSKKNKSSPPTVKQTVSKWLQTASPNDRQVALQFFDSLVGSKVMGEDSSVEQQEKLQRVKELLHSGSPVGAITVSRSQSPSKSASKPNLRYLRLLSPTTRENRWQHTTWHHLPNYADFDPVYNKSAIYTEPHALVPRHFKIHPDWGP